MAFFSFFLSSAVVIVQSHLSNYVELVNTYAHNFCIKFVLLLGKFMQFVVDACGDKL